MHIILPSNQKKKKTLLSKITIGGEIGSGKTTVGKKLAEYFNYNFISAGSIRREMAKKRGITIQELNILGETDSKTDLIPDRYQKILGKSDKNFIFEGKLSWYFIPNSLKLFYTVDESVGAERLLKEKRKSEINANSIQEQIKLNEKRTKSDIFRYNKIYGIENYFDKKHFDLIIDTSNLNQKEVYQKTIEEIGLLFKI